MINFILATIIVLLISFVLLLIINKNIRGLFYNKVWKKCLKDKPHKIASILVIGVIVFFILLLFFLIDSASYGEYINKNIAPLSALAGLIVLIFSVWGFVYNSASLNELRNEIIGTHEVFDDFTQHIQKLLTKVSYSGHGKLKHMTLVVSSLAYGIQSGDKKNAKLFYKVIHKYLDDVEEADEHRELQLYIWEKESHKALFGFKNDPQGVQNDKTNIVCKDLKKLLTRIKKIDENPKFTLKVHSTKKLDWRLFLYEKDEENFGMSVLFTPLVNKQLLATGKWAMSSYSSNSAGIDKHLTKFIETLDADGTKDITKEVLNIDTFIKEWFDLLCS